MAAKLVVEPTSCSQHLQRQHASLRDMLRPQCRPSRLKHCFSQCPANRNKCIPRECYTCQAIATEAPAKSAQMPDKHNSVAPSALTLVVVPHGKQHRLGVSWQEVISHVADRLAWESPNFKVSIFTDQELSNPDHLGTFQQTIIKADIMLVLDVQTSSILDTLANGMQAVPTSIALNSLPELEAATKLDNVIIETPWQKASAAAIPWGNGAKGTKILQSIKDVYQRNTSDDLLFMLLVLIDAYITKVPLVQSMQAQDLSTVWKMCTKCGKQIWACIKDPECKAALDCLTSCSSNDQVCSFRCIVSYESALLQDFSLCILQKNNCLGLSADIPAQPDVQPMTHFKGQPLSHEQAESIFIGWLGDKKWSWRVVAGQNVAYDQFPNQYQLFYHGKAKNSLWYDPVFQVQTLDDKTVWRRRHYRVRRAKQPGTFFFSVLDNGVISKEYWRIVHAAEDLSWALFYYAGAASVVGQAYRGAVLVTPTGQWPADDQQSQLEEALQQCGIKIWELYKVDNSSGVPAPLTVPEGPMKTVDTII